MSVETQHEFVWKQLKESAASVGIDVEKSGYGLMEVHNRLAKLEMEFEPDDVAEADRLLREFGNNEGGLELLYALGEACEFADGMTWAYRDYEATFENENEVKSAGWSSFEERSLCDFAMFTGIASAVCQSYRQKGTGSNIRDLFSHIGRKGAVKRHAPMRELESWAVQKYREGNWRSANEAAFELQKSIIAHGRTIGAILKPSNAQRTIAEWFRKSV